MTSKFLIDQIMKSPSPLLTQDFYLGDWLVCPSLNRLQHRFTSLERQLEPRLLHLLCYMANNSNQVFTRKELVQELWPKVVVNENSLTRAISELRKQLSSPDSVNNSTLHYIETIPKKGYRLAPAVVTEIADNTATLEPQSTRFHRPPSAPASSLWAVIFSKTFSKPVFNITLNSTVVSALSLSFILGFIFILQNSVIPTEEYSIAQISDELLENKPEYFGGKVTLSNMDNSLLDIDSIAKPIISIDEKQFAYIQYDANGSTIFLGDLSMKNEPLPVFNSNKYLFNLAWAPVGNNLLFAMKPVVATTAIYISSNHGAELLMLNLETFQTSRLVQESIPVEEKPASKSNLT
ncbi:MAG: hypothetical protein COA96_08775 [SAR86 cluster bacterium]|uniref:OmpR/PhoB-type domain-containing protein n=1 Tax=SAR86 cluster bacterium TaxID=2030880 RepID=A0A2A5AZL6_9GAMM|nr:MAG: hypothetical protein COA96_08775 [SAR86 cluster bacterium]